MKKENSNEKPAKAVSRCTTKAEINMTNGDVKRCSTSPIIREMQFLKKKKRIFPTQQTDKNQKLEITEVVADMREALIFMFLLLR